MPAKKPFPSFWERKKLCADSVGAGRCRDPAGRGLGDGLPVARSIPLALVPGLMLGLVLFFEKKTYTARIQIEFLIESSFLLTGVMAAIF